MHCFSIQPAAERSSECFENRWYNSGTRGRHPTLEDNIEKRRSAGKIYGQADSVNFQCNLAAINSIRPANRLIIYFSMTSTGCRMMLRRERRAIKVIGLQGVRYWPGLPFRGWPFTKWVTWKWSLCPWFLYANEQLSRSVTGRISQAKVGPSDKKCPGHGSWTALSHWILLRWKHARGPNRYTSQTFFWGGWTLSNTSALLD
jgi:hypothetical protein